MRSPGDNLTLDRLDPCATPEDRVEDGPGGDALLLIDESDLVFFFLQARMT
jgi:hypothetical protein